VDLTSSAINLRRVQANSFTIIGTMGVTPILNQPYSIKIVMLADAITVFLDGVSVINVSEPFNQTATKHGIRVGSLNIGVNYDNFRVEALL
jgi:hypothetical protein